MRSFARSGSRARSPREPGKKMGRWRMPPAPITRWWVRLLVLEEVGAEGEDDRLSELRGDVGARAADGFDPDPGLSPRVSIERARGSTRPDVFARGHEVPVLPELRPEGAATRRATAPVTRPLHDEDAQPADLPLRVVELHGIGRLD